MPKSIHIIIHIIMGILLFLCFHSLEKNNQLFRETNERSLQVKQRFDKIYDIVKYLIDKDIDAKQSFIFNRRKK